jgi:S-adenosylmethionine:tRNA ribosyltransferase-isomerase
MRIEDFDYDLPKSLIAQYPSLQRDESRLMIVDRHLGTIEHRAFRQISDCLKPGDLLIANNTQVLPARLMGKKKTGGKVEILLIPSWNGAKGEWEALIKGLGRKKQGVQIQLGQDLYGEVEEVKDGRVKMSFSIPVLDILRKVGHIPIPPYIKRNDEPLDRDRYQTIFAEREGSIAAPTAGLHFTQDVLQSLRNQKVNVTSITLHIGVGTFAPIRRNDIRDHTMEPEWVEIPVETAKQVEEAKARGGRVIAVGTTTTRALESFPDGNGGLRFGKGMSSLFIYPPYRFQVVDGLITNFHLPKSSLILLVSAFAGKKLLMEAYQEAIEKKYRFYSYGDAMLIL